MTRPACATCAAFEPTNPSERHGIGECRLRAPSPQFPIVYGHKWCLEHKPISDKLDPERLPAVMGETS